MCKALLTSAKFYLNPSPSVTTHLRVFFLSVPYPRVTLCSNLSYRGTLFTNPWNSKIIQEAPQTVSLSYRNE